MNDLDTVSQACAYLLETVPEAEPVRAYLKTRASTESIKHFEFGYFPDQNNIKALTSIVDESILVRAKLRFDRANNDGIFRKIKSSLLEYHNLIMPYRDAYGKTVALVGRTLASSKEMEDLKIPKYKNTFFKKKSHVFGFNDARPFILKSDGVIVVEGQFDCIAAHERGIKNVVALGSASMTLYQLGLLMRYTKNIYLFLDNDKAGREGAERILNRLGSFACFENKHVPLGYKDLDDFLKDCQDTTYQDLIHL